MKKLLLFLALALGCAAQTILPTTALFGGQVSPAAPSGGAATFSSVTDTGLTSGRFVLAGTGGLFVDDEDIAYNSTSVLYGTGLTGGLQIYNTADQTTNYERLELLWSSNLATIQTVKGGSGALRDILIGSANSIQIRPTSSSSGQIALVGITSSIAGNVAVRIGSTNTATSGSNVGGLSITPTYSQASGTAANTDLKIARVETALGSGAQAFVDLYAGVAGTTQKYAILNTGKVSSYAGVATAGYGHPGIYAAGRVTAQSAAGNIATYTVGAADGSFEVSANLNCTVATSLITTLTCTYTDESNTARTMILPVTQLSGSFIALGAVTGTGAWETPVMHIRCKAATVITILTSAGTFTGVTFTAEGVIKQTN